MNVSYMIISRAIAKIASEDKSLRSKVNSLLRNIAKNDAESYHQRLIDDVFNGMAMAVGQGKPYKAFDTSKVNEGDTVNIVFSGAWDGSQNGKYGSYGKAFDQAPGHTAMYRFNDIERAEKDLKELIKKKVKIKLFGHSYGSSPANTLAYKYGIDDLTLADPVKRFLKIKSGAKVYRPSSRKITESFDNFISWVGGLQATDKNSKEVYGDHFTSAESAAADSLGIELKEPVKLHR